MKQIKRSMKNIFKDLKHHELLLAYITMAILSDFVLRMLTVGGIFRLRPVITTAALMLLVSPILIMLAGKERKYVYMIFAVLVTALNVSNYLYYTHFNNFISLGIFKQAKQLGEMKNNLSQTLNFKMFLFLIPFYLFYRYYKKGDFLIQDKNYSIQRQVLSPFVLGLALILFVSTSLTGTDLSRIKKQWNREYLVEEFGIYSYSTADFVKTVSVPKVVEADYADFDEKLQELVSFNEKNRKKNAYTDILKGKDLYVIHYESVQNFAMDLSFEDGEVTPFLNKLSKEGLFFSNFYPQHSVGTSSDSEFTFATSLYPINRGTVFIDHADKEYESLQKSLNEAGYYTMSLHGNNGAFWNRDIMHPNLGYQEFLHKQDYVIDEEVGLGLSDMSFYRQSVQMLKERKEGLDQPIMATLITLSNHYPFDELDVYGDFDTGYLEDLEIANYLKSMNYADQSLAFFFQEMEKAGLLDNAAVLIYGDHHAKISQKDFEYLYNYDLETETVRSDFDEEFISIDNAFMKQVRKTPLILWTKEQSFKKEVTEPLGMIDVAPTLSNMLAVHNPYQLGKDIFNQDQNRVIFPDGSFLTKNYYYNASNLRVYDMETNEILMKKDDLDEKTIQEIEAVEDELEFSSKIIENNLIKYNKKGLLPNAGPQEKN